MAKKTPTGRGRPKKQPGESRSVVLQVRLTPEERALLDQAARTRGVDTSTWVRMEVLAIARRDERGSGA